MHPRFARSRLALLAAFAPALVVAHRPVRDTDKGDKGDKPTTPTTPAKEADKPATFTEAEVTARVDGAVKSALAATLKRLGVEKIEDAEGALKTHREKAEAEKSEVDRYKSKVDELGPRAKRAEVLEGTLKRYLEAEEGAVPKEKKDLLDLAPSADHPEARLEWIVNARKKGLFGAASPPSAEPRPANSRAGGPPPAPAPAAHGAKHPRDMTDLEFAAWQAERRARLGQS